MKILSGVLLAAVFMTFSGGTAFAAQEPASAQAKIVDVGNTKCPVMGGPVSGKDFIVYEGKRYGTCCAGCPEEFEKNPGKYLASLKAVTPA
ncbi:MAG: hypothetical protein WC352_01050 [Candidatus Omnitrophota bacterium]